MRSIEARLDGLTQSQRQERARRRPHNNVRPVYASPATMRAYLDEYLTTGANYLCLSFQFGSLTHGQAMRSIELFVTQIMPHYQGAASAAV
jgi:hypothetical protein